ncbi:MAG: polysaccharide deacetylase family protein [bacterium]|nr:polysaccharide deacetylase family protein [bacterium]
MTDRKKAPLSLDLDNKWSYLKTHGDDAWQEFPSYLETIVPRALSVLDEWGWNITWFLVGKDAEITDHHDILRSISDAGHEIGNHSFLHEPWLHQYTQPQLIDDLGRAHDAIGAATGQTAVGFRGPGFSLSADTLEVLESLGYKYDATTFPNALNPIGRFYYLRTSNLSDEEKERRSALFGTMKDARRSNRPYEWSLANGNSMVEIPVTTMPLFRVPIHFSYLLFLGGKSQVLAKLYWKMALTMCRIAGTVPSLLLHPLDFLGQDDEPDLAFFPGMNIESSKKLDLINQFLAMWDGQYETTPLGPYVDQLTGLKTKEPDLMKA